MDNIPRGLFCNTENDILGQVAVYIVKNKANKNPQIKVLNLCKYVKFVFVSQPIFHKFFLTYAEIFGEFF